MEKGTEKMDRTGTGTLSYFSPPDLNFSLLNDSLPLLTTKTVPFKTVLKELLFFISGKTDTKYLKDQGVHIWDGNTSTEFISARGLPYQEGDMGPSYGFQWRHSGAQYVNKDTDYTNQGTDQLMELINGLKTDPDSRRHIICAWNPNDITKMALPPCHALYQVWTREDAGKRYITAKMYQRSADSFLGVPFNIASYAILTHILGYMTGYIPERLVCSYGDYHIYLNHLDQVKEQLTRSPRPFPTLKIKAGKANICDLTLNDFTIVDYNPHGALSAKMAI
jgi:thymidylate synthase